MPERREGGRQPKEVNVEEEVRRARALPAEDRLEILSNLVEEIAEIKKMGTKEEKARLLDEKQRLFEIYRNSGSQE